MALRVLLPLSGPDRVTLIGRREQLDPLSAVFINFRANSSCSGGRLCYQG
jgi:hypothetical protein